MRSFSVNFLRVSPIRNLVKSMLSGDSEYPLRISVRKILKEIPVRKFVKKVGQKIAETLTKFVKKTLTGFVK